MNLIIADTVRYDYIKADHKSTIWTINGQEIVLMLPIKYASKLRDILFLLNSKLKNNEPLYEVVEALGRHGLFNTMKIIQQYFLEDYLIYFHQHFIKKENEGTQGTFDSFMKECIDRNTDNAIQVLSKYSKVTLRDVMVNYVIDGRVKSTRH